MLMWLGDELRMCVDVACVRVSEVCWFGLRVVFWGLPGFWRRSGLYV